MQQVLNNRNNLGSLSSPKQAGFLTVLFLVAQILCCFHTHDPLTDHQDGPVQEADCTTCLQSHTPFNIGEATQLTPSNLVALALVIREPATRYTSHLALPQQARAPPHL